METAESRALHSDVKLNKAGVMFSFISPVIALTLSVVVPGKVRIFWETVWICWEFWPQSPLLSALHRGENKHRTKTWILRKSICGCCYCLSQPVETHLSDRAVGHCSVAEWRLFMVPVFGYLAWRSTVSAVCSVDACPSLDCRDVLFLEVPHISEPCSHPFGHSTPAFWFTGMFTGESRHRKGFGVCLSLALTCSHAFART